MNLGETIYRLRTERNLSQGDLADALDVSRQSVSKWENNSAVPELEKLIKMAQIFGISAQLCVMAFAFGDGFSNVAYPTNPALLISLGLADVSYSDWFRFSMRFQWMNLLLTGGILLLGLVVGY